jgi:hypothetical protein
LALSHNNLENYFNIVFQLAQHHKYSIKEIEEIIPFERDIYVQMLKAHLEKKKSERSQG